MVYVVPQRFGCCVSIEKGIYEIDEINALLFAIRIDPLTGDTPV
jgi:hypothetical protein